MFQQYLKYLQWLLLHPDFQSGAANLARLERNFKCSKPDDGVGPQWFHTELSLAQSLAFLDPAAQNIFRVKPMLIKYLPGKHGAI
jgi:hypothetical protein